MLETLLSSKDSVTRVWSGPHRLCASAWDYSFLDRIITVRADSLLLLSLENREYSPSGRFENFSVTEFYSNSAQPSNGV